MVTTNMLTKRTDGRDGRCDDAGHSHDLRDETNDREDRNQGYNDNAALSIFKTATTKFPMLFQQFGQPHSFGRGIGFTCLTISEGQDFDV